MSQLDPSCPSGGKWFACLTGSNFVGCCASDNACSSIGCSAGNLRPASFNPAGYATVADQSCPAGAQWYTCAANDPPFMGCCKSNPCGKGCPTADLAAGILNPQSAQGYTNQTLPSATPTAVPAAAAAAAVHHGPSPGVIAGIAVGGAAGVAIVAIISFICWRRVKKARRYARNSEATIIRRDVFDPFGEGAGVAGGQETKNLSSGVSQVDPTSPMPHTPIPNTPAPKYQSNKSSPWQQQQQQNDYAPSPMTSSEIGTVKATPPPYYSSSQFANQPEMSEYHHQQQLPHEIGSSSPIASPGLGLSSPGPHGPVAFPPAELPGDDMPAHNYRS